MKAELARLRLRGKCPLGESLCPHRRCVVCAAAGASQIESGDLYHLFRRSQADYCRQN